jgi:hypothetical protein
VRIASILASSDIGPPQSRLDELFLRAHEGVQVLSWSTLGGKDFDGFGARECLSGRLRVQNCVCG